MTAFLYENSKRRLLLSQFLYQSRFISKCFSYLHANFSLWLFSRIKFTIIQNEFLILEKHWNSQRLNWVNKIFQKFLQHGIFIHQIDKFWLLCLSTSKQETKLNRFISSFNNRLLIINLRMNEPCSQKLSGLKQKMPWMLIFTDAFIKFIKSEIWILLKLILIVSTSYKALTIVLSSQSRFYHFVWYHFIIIFLFEN